MRRSQAFLLSIAAGAMAAAMVGVTAVQAEPAAVGEPDQRSAKRAPNPWTKVSGDLNLLNEADLLRVGNRLHVVWSQDDGGEDSVRTRILNAQGAIASPVRPVVTGWLALIVDPKILRDGDDLRAVFSGIRSSAPGEQYVGRAFSAASQDGLTWALEPGSLSQTTAAGNAESIDAINGAGEPMFAMGGFDSHVTMHRGLIPPADADFVSSDVDCCPPTFVKLANNRGSGEVWVAWHPLSATEPDEAGIFTQKVWPRPNGTLLKAPGSSTPSGQALNPGQPVAMAERVGGGVWLAYRRGYPTSTTIRVWKAGTNTFWDVKSALTVDSLTLTAGPGGRLWLSWRTVGDGKIHAARTNPQATKLGAVRTLNPPGGDGSIWNTTTEGSAGPLDIVVNAQTTQPPALYAAHILPGLTVKVRPKSLAQGRVTVTVTDAGDPVRGARVAFRGVVVRTNAAGIARLMVGRAVPDGRYLVAVNKSGYAKGAARVTVT